MDATPRHDRSPRSVTAPRPVSRQRTDTRPWYRQFWPWFLIALPASAVVLSFATLYVALENADEVLPHEGDSATWSAPRAVPASPPPAVPASKSDDPAAAPASP